MLNYQVDRSKLPPNLASSAIDFHYDSATARFREECAKTFHSPFQLLLYNLLSMIIPEYEVHGLLGMFPMFLLHENHWRALLGDEHSVCPFRNTLLDIGAGQGFVTQHARKFFRTIYTTETSHTMARKLRAFGFLCQEVDIAQYPQAFGPKKFSVVSLLNILDRCEYPLTLLSKSVELMEDNGLLMIADPLPLDPYVRGRGRTVPQKESLPRSPSARWEECLVHFVENVIIPRGLEVVRLTRLPYLYKGTKNTPYYSLDDFVVVCRKQPNSRKKIIALQTPATLGEMPQGLFYQNS